MVVVVGVIAAAMASAIRLYCLPEIPLLVCFVVIPELESEVECIAQTI